MHWLQPKHAMSMHATKVKWQLPLFTSVQLCVKIEEEEEEEKGSFWAHVKWWVTCPEPVGCMHTCDCDPSTTITTHYSPRVYTPHFPSAYFTIMIRNQRILIFH